MTFRSRIFKAMPIGLAVLALSASVTSAAPTTYQEHQAIAARGVGAPVPRVVNPNAQLRAIASANRTAVAQPATPRTKSSDGFDWGILVLLVGAGLAACVAVVTMVRHRTTAVTPR